MIWSLFFGSLATLLPCRLHWVSLHCHLKQWVSPTRCFQTWPLCFVQYCWPGKLKWNGEELWRLIICKNSNHQKYSFLFKLAEVILWYGSGEDGKSRADQLQHLLKNLDRYVSSPVEYQRQRACHAVVALLKQFQAFCTSGNCPFNCIGDCMHLRSTTERGQSSSAGTGRHTMHLRRFCPLWILYLILTFIASIIINHLLDFHYVLRDPTTRWELLWRNSYWGIGEHSFWLFYHFHLHLHNESLITELVKPWWNTAALLLPPREGLKLGERTMAYIPRCADVSPEVRKVSTQVLILETFSIPCSDRSVLIISGILLSRQWPFHF